MTTRASAYELWMNAPNPMVTFFKTLDVTNLVRMSRKKGYKFNMLLDYCIGKAAAPIKEFYMLPVGDRLIKYDTLAVNTIVKNREGEVSCCDRDLSEDSMVIGTSAIIDTEIDGAVGMNSGTFNNPFMLWGKYRKKLFRYYLPVSFQFHYSFVSVFVSVLNF